MKKIILSIVCVLSLSVNAQTSKVINYPFGAAQAFVGAATGTVIVTISNQCSYMSAVPTLTAASTLSLTAASTLKAGAVMLVSVKTTSTEITTFAGSVIAPAVTGAAGKTWTQAFMYNGTSFYPMGAKIQVD